MFVLNSDISIGSFHFKGVNEVHISCSLNSIVATATIKVPAIARIIKEGKRSPDTVVTADQFKEGDAVIIKLGYDNELHTEFKGFVKSRDMNMPLVITCEGYSWLLRRNKVNISKTAVTVKSLLSVAVKGIDSRYTITVKCNLDLVLNNIQINGTGLDVINSISKYTDGSVCCFFIEPDVLWCGLYRTAYVNGNDIMKKGKVSYRLGYNVLKQNTLKERTVKEDAVQITYSKKLSTGSLITQSSDAFKEFVRKHSRILNQVSTAASLKALANEKAYSINYSGFEGAVNTFLAPFVSQGYTASIIDTTNKNVEGIYLVEGVETHFGIHGAGRKVEIGPLVGFANK